MSKLATKIKSQQPRTFRKELLKKKKELLTAIGVNFNTLAGSGTKSEDDLTVASHEQVVGLGMNRVFSDQLREVESAISRLGFRHYGTCLACGAAIASKRLRAVPWAKYCVGCQDKATAEDEGEFSASAIRSEYLPASNHSHPE